MWRGANDPHAPQWFTSRYFVPGQPFPFGGRSCFGLRTSVLVQSLQTPTHGRGRASADRLNQTSLTSELLA
jgi:hypothetical protein